MGVILDNAMLFNINAVLNSAKNRARYSLNLYYIFKLNNNKFEAWTSSERQIEWNENILRESFFQRYRKNMR